MDGGAKNKERTGLRICSPSCRAPATPRTGESLSDQNIRYQVLTLLIGGHETTSGMLSFAFHYLSTHPEVMAKAVEEADRVLGPDPTAVPTFDEIKQLKYDAQVLKESLRLWPSAS